MPAAWSRLEVEAIVSDYCAMLETELRGEVYSKAAHSRALGLQLSERSKQSIEFKHANISSIMIELGMPYIDGYKPRGNYQGLLHDVVSERLAGTSSLVRAAEADVDAAILMPTVDDILLTLVDPPRARHRDSTRTVGTPSAHRDRQVRVNYLEREASNRQLGAVGERFVLAFEQARLIRAGQERLAAQIEHVSVTRGDGEGYDILSFETSGKERLIEVKATRYGAQTPFFVSHNERIVSEREAARYRLYRAFGFKKEPKLFQLSGALSTSCVLSPVSYLASVA